MLNHILIAIDQSAASHHAFATGLELAAALRAPLTLVHVLDVFDPAAPQRPDLPASSYSLELDTLLRQTHEREWSAFVTHYEALLRQKQEAAAERGIVARFLQPYGQPGPALCQTAREENADLIILGSHGRSGLRELVLGSVSNYVTHHAPCSVMVVHPDSRPAPTAVAAEAAAV